MIRLPVRVALLVMTGTGPVLPGFAGALAQDVPQLLTTEMPLFHSSTSSDDRVLQIGRLFRAKLLSPDRFAFVDISFRRLVFVNSVDGAVVSAGREGDGPREFRVPVLVSRSGDGGVAVWDAGHRRFALVDGDGVFAEAPAYDESTLESRKTGLVARYDDGTVVIRDDAWPIGAPFGDTPQPGPFRDTVRFETLLPGEPARLIARYLGDESYYEKDQSRPGSATTSVIFGHVLLATQVGRHLAVAQTDLGVIHVLDLTGTRVAEIPLPPAVRVSQDHINAERKRRDESRARAEPQRPSRFLPFEFRDRPFADAARPIDRMLGDLDSRLWLRAFRFGGEREYWQAWNISGPSLEFTLTLPVGEELLDAAGNRVLVRTRDEFDVDYVVLREIEGYSSVGSAPWPSPH